MFNLSFQSTFLAAFQILLMGGCGYFLTKRAIVDGGGLSTLSHLVIDFFLPCLIFNQLIQNFSFSLYPDWWKFPLLSFGVTLGGFFLGQGVLLGCKNMTYKKAFKALITFQNAGYIPLILVKTLFPAEQTRILFVYIFLFTMGFDLVLWSIGVNLFARQRTEFKTKDFFSSIHLPAIAIIVSLILIALGLQKFIPGIVLKPVGMFGDCAIPLSMIVVGGNLACLNVRDIKPHEVFLVAITKLILFPILALMILMFHPVDYWIGFLIVLETAVPSSVSLSVISRRYKVEESFINQGLTFTHLACVVTIPVFLMLYGKMFAKF